MSATFIMRIFVTLIVCHIPGIYYSGLDGTQCVCWRSETCVMYTSQWSRMKEFCTFEQRDKATITHEGLALQPQRAMDSGQRSVVDNALTPYFLSRNFSTCEKISSMVPSATICNSQNQLHHWAPTHIYRQHSAI